MVAEMILQLDVSNHEAMIQPPSAVADHAMLWALSAENNNRAGVDMLTGPWCGLVLCLSLLPLKLSNARPDMPCVNAVSYKSMHTSAMSLLEPIPSYEDIKRQSKYQSANSSLSKLLLDEECSQMRQLPCASDTENSELDKCPADNAGVCVFGLIAELSFTFLLTY